MSVSELQTQLVWNRLLAIVEEQAQTLMRTAFSTVVREAGDLSAGVFNPDGEMLAQAVTGTPGHVNAMAASVGKFLRRHPLETLRPGDVLLTNDPWDGTGHLNDFTVVTPVFLGDACVGLFASTSHIADVGGRGFGPDANDLFEEGLRIPITFLFREGVRDETLMMLVAANVRDPIVAEGDLYSLTACNDTGARQLVEMMDDFKLASLDGVGREILEISRGAMMDEIRSLPPGEYGHAMRIDGYESPVDLVCSLTVSGNGIDIDWTGTSPASGAGINVPLPYTEAYASFGVRCVVGNEVPNNAGSLGAITVTAPRGCILNAEAPRAVSARHAVGQMLPDVVLGCLAQVVPERVPAEGASCIWNPVFLNAPSASGGNDPVTQFVTNPIYNGGTGARPGKDGLSTTAFPSGVRTTSTEVNEATTPLLIWRKEYRSDSAGPGEHRGGLGQTIEIAHASGDSFVISKMFDRIGHPARGRHGGGDGEPGRVFVQGGDDFRGKGRDLVPPGATLVLETPGGAGMGKVGRRDPERIAADVEAGLISPEAARSLYGFEPGAPVDEMD
ncbi:MAG: hydantoinase B/oxoprolinase family protein [Pseudomonadales bacterium]|nr:hydantoinase B/oxoprolinase family protein [Pseudomonadales bacterium]NIX07902.1 hydantoinase B/oxoprolinase family protein [Pseudomonadales bacterium]